jgi:hypothetical protein
MLTMRGIVDDLRPSYADTDYYIRLTTGCLFVTAFFVVSGIVSMKEFSEYEGYQGQEGNTFYYSDREAILGSAGMAYVAFVLAAIALVTGLVFAAWKWRFGLVDGLRTFGTVVVVCAITGAMAGLFGAGIVQLGLGAIGLRGLYWALLPLLGIAAVFGVLLYAKEAKGSLRDA